MLPTRFYQLCKLNKFLILNWTIDIFYLKFTFFFFERMGIMVVNE